MNYLDEKKKKKKCKQNLNDLNAIKTQFLKRKVHFQFDPKWVSHTVDHDSELLNTQILIPKMYKKNSI